MWLTWGYLLLIHVLVTLVGAKVVCDLPYCYPVVRNANLLRAPKSEQELRLRETCSSSCHDDGADEASPVLTKLMNAIAGAGSTNNYAPISNIPITNSGRPFESSNSSITERSWFAHLLHSLNIDQGIDSLYSRLDLQWIFERFPLLQKLKQWQSSLQIKKTFFGLLPESSSERNLHIMQGFPNTEKSCEPPNSGKITWTAWLRSRRENLTRLEFQGLERWVILSGSIISLVTNFISLISWLKKRLNTGTKSAFVTDRLNAQEPAMLASLAQSHLKALTDPIEKIPLSSVLHGEARDVQDSILFKRKRGDETSRKHQATGYLDRRESSESLADEGDHDDDFIGRQSAQIDPETKEDVNNGSDAGERVAGAAHGKGANRNEHTVGAVTNDPQATGSQSKTCPGDLVSRTGAIKETTPDALTETLSEEVGQINAVIDFVSDPMKDMKQPRVEKSLAAKETKDNTQKTACTELDSPNQEYQNSSGHNILEKNASMIDDSPIQDKGRTSKPKKVRIEDVKTGNDSDPGLSGYASMDTTKQHRRDTTKDNPDEQEIGTAAGTEDRMQGPLQNSTISSPSLLQTPESSKAISTSEPEDQAWTPRTPVSTEQSQLSHLGPALKTPEDSYIRYKETASSSNIFLSRIDGMLKEIKTVTHQARAVTSPRRLREVSSDIGDYRSRLSMTTSNLSESWSEPSSTAKSEGGHVTLPSDSIHEFLNTINKHHRGEASRPSKPANVKQFDPESPLANRSQYGSKMRKSASMYSTSPSSPAQYSLFSPSTPPVLSRKI